MRRKAPKLLHANRSAVALLLPRGRGRGRGDQHARRPVQRLRWAAVLRRSAAPPATATGAGAADSKRVPFGRAEMQLSFAPLVKETAPAVVNVYASQKVQARSPFEGDPFFEQFFGDGRCRRACSSRWAPACWSIASGHRRHQFPRHPGRRRGEGRDRPTGANSTSKVLLKDESLDLAVLKIESPRAVSGRCRSAIPTRSRSATWCSPSATRSASARPRPAASSRRWRASHIGVSDFGFFIQTDAAINPGNSGGALINMARPAGRHQHARSTAAAAARSASASPFPSNMVRAVVDCGQERQRLLRAALYRRRPSRR